MKKRKGSIRFAVILMFLLVPAALMLSAVHFSRLEYSIYSSEHIKLDQKLDSFLVFAFSEVHSKALLATKESVLDPATVFLEDTSVFKNDFNVTELALTEISFTLIEDNPINFIAQLSYNIKIESREERQDLLLNFQTLDSVNIDNVELITYNKGSI